MNNVWNITWVVSEDTDKLTGLLLLTLTDGSLNMTQSNKLLEYYQV